MRKLFSLFRLQNPETSVCSRVSHKEAVEAFDVTIRYLDQQPSMDSVQLMLLIKLRSSAMTECLKSMKQTNITDYFIPNTDFHIYVS